MVVHRNTPNYGERIYLPPDENRGIPVPITREVDKPVTGPRMDTRREGTTMKRGSHVLIYEDPITRTKLEGQATILTLYPGDYDKETGLHLARVEFHGDGMRVVRWFKKSDVRP